MFDNRPHNWMHSLNDLGYLNTDSMWQQFLPMNSPIDSVMVWILINKDANLFAILTNKDANLFAILITKDANLFAILITKDANLFAILINKDANSYRHHLFLYCKMPDAKCTNTRVNEVCNN